jgi:predicted RecB family nuclease
MKTINNNNYYDDDRISQSKLKDYLHCPSLYKARWVDKTLEIEKTEAMVFGDAVDTLLTEGRDSFDKRFEIVKRRNKDAKKIQITETIGTKIFKTVDKVQRQPVMTMFKGSSKQVILTHDDLKGKLDYLLVKGRTGYIADLKTINNLDKMEFAVMDYGYIMQMAFYRMLAKHNYPKVKSWKCYWIFVDKSEQIKFAVYEIKNSNFKSQETYIKKILRHLKENTEFNRRLGVGVCQVCPPEIDCRWSKFKKKDILKY